MSRYVNPFDEKIDMNKLIHLSSGVHVDENNANSILGTFKVGVEQSSTFNENFLLTDQIKFHSEINKQELLRTCDDMQFIDHE